MDLERLGSLGWREGVIAIIGLLLVYIIVLYLRLRRLQQALPVPSPLAAQAALAAYRAVQGSAPAPPASVALDPPAPTEALTADAAQAVTTLPAFAWNEPPAEIPAPARLDALQRELQALRREVDELRVAVLEARQDYRQHLAAASPQDASPRYKDAMQMAVEGQDATSIANHCGIARAEADLVVALARNRRRGV